MDCNLLNCWRYPDTRSAWRLPDLIATSSHRVHYKPAGRLEDVGSESVDLVVTSPPYPMIEMWDDDFCAEDETIRSALSDGDGRRAFELMHQQLDQVWRELNRVLKAGGIACINIGDATRTLNGVFQLYSSHSRIISAMLSRGFQNLPNIIWRKTTNAPNKFMGSGMLPPGAYVTLEHEYILIFRKGNKRGFTDNAAKQNRRRSAYFWEERNKWFSDVWSDLTGTVQTLEAADLRQRSGAYPFELAYRLINMFSVKEDTVLDPFLGTGTTMYAAMASERHSIGYERDDRFRDYIADQIPAIGKHINQMILDRLQRHIDFATDRIQAGKPPKFSITGSGIPCISRQETDISLSLIRSVTEAPRDTFSVEYRPLKVKWQDRDSLSSTRSESTLDAGRH